MYNTQQEYLDALAATGLKPGDIVTIARQPVPKDGNAIMFEMGLEDTLWASWYRALEVGKSYTIRYLDTQGMIYTTPDCGFRIPFFILEGYDHHIQTLQQISKSKYLSFDKMANKIKRELVRW